jgi:hypothetical protein
MVEMQKLLADSGAGFILDYSSGHICPEIFDRIDAYRLSAPFTDDFGQPYGSRLPFALTEHAERIGEFAREAIRQDKWIILSAEYSDENDMYADYRYIAL